MAGMSALEIACFANEPKLQFVKYSLSMQSIQTDRTTTILHYKIY